MARIMSKPEYEEWTASTRDKRMEWWREARFGMFVHFGLYSVLGRHEWAQAMENIPSDEYAKLADKFNPKPGAPREWARLAKAAGMKYMVMTTRHHEGFSLWDSKANPFNSVNYGPHRDIVREFVDACREFDLKIGFYSSLMDWHHPDGWTCAFDTDARRRFTDYIEALNTELLTNYGKIDILWYDVSRPMQSWEGWDSLVRNQRLRQNARRTDGLSKRIAAGSDLDEQGTGRLMLIEALCAQIQIPAQPRCSAVQKRLKLESCGEVFLPVRMGQAALICADDDHELSAGVPLYIGSQRHRVAVRIWGGIPVDIEHHLNGGILGKILLNGLTHALISAVVVRIVVWRGIMQHRDTGLCKKIGDFIADADDGVLRIKGALLIGFLILPSGFHGVGLA